MRFQENDAAKWTRLPTLKALTPASDVVHHNTLNARPVDADVERSREVERFFDLMTPTTPTMPTTPAQGTPR